ncbi:MAG: hypothetical protein MAG551_00114 [Candidatus Scalindua arabica]|uniref:Uncharacterized protein n=1 Tax=Candidatus Scalindua arabica TaxID=1127984 RepID=A0A941VZP8_9BACT|nr:hypothetical protein [Candidatus Scalindua arabica]
MQSRGDLIIVKANRKCQVFDKLKMSVNKSSCKYKIS